MVPVAPVQACNQLLLFNRHGYCTEINQETMAHVIGSTFRQDSLEFKLRRQEALNKTLMAQLRELTLRMDRLENEMELTKGQLEKQEEELTKQKILREHLAHRQTDIDEMMNFPGVQDIMKDLDSVSL